VVPRESFIGVRYLFLAQKGLHPFPQLSEDSSVCLILSILPQLSHYPCLGKQSSEGASTFSLVLPWILLKLWEIGSRWWTQRQGNAIGSTTGQERRLGIPP